jgi:hypothetical protein
MILVTDLVMDVCEYIIKRHVKLLSDTVEIQDVKII